MTYRETLREVRTRAQRRTGNLYDTLFTRRVSAWITAALVPLKASPNVVSAVNCFVGAAACGLVAFGDRSESVVGALLVHAYAVLDSVDGELARYFRRPSLRGMFLEDYSAYVMINGWFLAVGLWLTRRPPLPPFAAITPWWPVCLAVVFVAFARNAMPVARRVVLAVLQKNGASATRVGHASEPERPRRLRRFVEESLLAFTNIWVVLSTLIVVGDSRAVAAAFLFYLAGLFSKEVLIVALMLGTPRLEREIAAASHAGEESQRTMGGAMSSTNVGS